MNTFRRSILWRFSWDASTPRHQRSVRVERNIRASYSCKPHEHAILSGTRNAPPNGNTLVYQSTPALIQPTDIRELESCFLTISDAKPFRQLTEHWERIKNKDIFKGNWKQIKGAVQQHWGELTNDDLDRIEGSHEGFAGRIQERYGKSKDEAEREVSDWESRQG